MSFGLVVMGIIIVFAFLTVAAVMYYGSKENVAAHGLSAEESRAVQAWQQRAEAASRTLKALTPVNEAATAASGSRSLLSDEDKEAKRQAALARKAARESKRASSSE
ncbi:MAG: hypothetical protein NZ750_09890 [Anaerolineae bacterium]|nr:hypothetical protein [Anaerolineae bacterium]MDW8171932.1 hypothetical protein [Anaerolineae bacterium]